MAPGIPPQGTQAESVTAQALEVTASIDVDNLIARLTSETRKLLNDYGQRGLAGPELATAVADGLEGLSNVPLELAGRGAVSEGFNLGRNMGIQENLDAVAVVVRTEVLDENTCRPCRELDGRVVEVNSPDYWFLMPPNECEGRELCRGFYLARAAA